MPPISVSSCRRTPSDLCAADPLPRRAGGQRFGQRRHRVGRRREARDRRWRSTLRRHLPAQVQAERAAAAVRRLEAPRAAPAPAPTPGMPFSSLVGREHDRLRAKRSPIQWKPLPKRGDRIDDQPDLAPAGDLGHRLRSGSSSPAPGTRRTHRQTARWLMAESAAQALYSTARAGHWFRHWAAPGRGTPR